mgnify:CR=1 FL=1
MLFQCCAKITACEYFPRLRNIHWCGDKWVDTNDIKGLVLQFFTLAVFNQPRHLNGFKESNVNIFIPAHKWLYLLCSIYRLQCDGWNWNDYDLNSWRSALLTAFAHHVNSNTSWWLWIVKLPQMIQYNTRTHRKKFKKRRELNYC